VYCVTKHSCQFMFLKKDGRGKTYSDERTVLSKTEVTASICTKRGARSKVGRVVSRGALSAAAMLLEKDSSGPKVQRTDRREGYFIATGRENAPSKWKPRRISGNAAISSPLLDSSMASVCQSLGLLVDPDVFP
jgi:hypothetical protein